LWKSSQWIEKGAGFTFFPPPSLVTAENYPVRISFGELWARQRFAKRRLPKMATGNIPSSLAMRYPFDIAVAYALLLLVMCCVMNLALA
jgi:hypothetical protein